MPMPVTLKKTELPGVLLVECGRAGDSRGFFSEVYSRTMWEGAGFAETFVQDNLSKSAKGTLRGLHYQIEPHGMGKLVRAVTGAVFDVAVDIRRGSPTFGKWVGRILSADNHLALWIPRGFAHGFMALEDGTLFFYKCTTFHAPEAERTILYNDPAIAIQWPLEPTAISPKDQTAPPLAEAEYNFQFEG